MGNRLLYGIVGVALLLLVVSFIIPTLSERNQPTPPSQSRSISDTNKKTPDPSASEIPFKVDSSKATLKTISGTTITVEQNSKTLTLPLSKTINIQRVTSGSIDTGDANVVKASLQDLKPDQQIQVTTDQQTQLVTSIVILR